MSHLETSKVALEVEVTKTEREGTFEEQQKGECGLEQSDQGRYDIKYVIE